jgi:hypothetical protein
VAAFYSPARGSQSKRMDPERVFIVPRRTRLAEGLGVTVRDGRAFDPDYLRIKCNISRKDKEKIFHLPFDQMYDRIKNRA